MAPSTLPVSGTGTSDGATSFLNTKLGMAVAAGAAVGGCALVYYLVSHANKGNTGAAASATSGSASKTKNANAEQIGASESGAADSSGNHSNGLLNGDAAATSPTSPALSSTAELKSAGNESFKAKHWQEAIERYTQAIAVGTDDDKTLVAQCYCNRAAAHVNMEQYGQAVSDCTAALALEPEYFRALKRRADVHETMGNLKACIRDLFAAIRACDANKDKGDGLKGGRRQHEQTMRDFDRALVDYGLKEATAEVSRREPCTPADCLIETFLAGYGPNLESESTSIDDLTAQLQGASGADAGVLHYRRAVAYVQAKKYDMVLDEASKAVALLRDAGEDYKMHLVSALSLEGDWLSFSGVPGRAVRALDEALSLDPTHTLSRVRRALVHAFMQEEKAAIDMLKKARDDDPNNLAAFFLSAQMIPRLVSANSPVNPDGTPVNPHDPAFAAAVQESASYFQHCIDRGFDSAHAYVNLASLQLQLGQPMKAKATMEVAEKKWPNELIVYIFKGQHLLRPGQDPSEAFACWDKAAKIDPASPLPALQRAHVLLQQQSTIMQGLAVLRECVKIEPKFDPAHQLLGQLAMQGQDWNTAISHFDQSIKYARETKDMSLAFGFKEVCLMRLEQQQA